MPGGGFTPRYRCFNPHCPEGFHFSRVCPYPARPRPLSEWERRAWDEYVRLERAGAFDLRRRPLYMREREEKRTETSRPDPGYAWLLVFVPVALLVGGGMLALMFL